MHDVSGRTIVITGGAQGIGLGMARAFAKAGARVALTDLDEDHLATAEHELILLTGDSSAVTTFAFDVRDRAAFARVIDGVEERLGPVAVLCNNAGLGLTTTVTDLQYAQWDHVLEVNLGGVVNGVQTVLPRMLARGGPGHIVNTASGAGLVATPNLAYVTSKFAVVGMSESLRLQPELRDNGIEVTVVCPGLVRTDVIRNSARDEGTTGDPKVEEAHAMLQQYGLDPAVVGEQVLAAVQANEPYVHTDRSLATRIEQRMRALLAALPPETDHDRQVAALQARIAAQTQASTDNDQSASNRSRASDRGRAGAKKVYND